MFDWGSFTTGLVGALVGGAASLLVQGLSARRDRHARRREAVERLGRAFRDCVAPLVTHRKEKNNSREVFLTIQEVAAATTGLRLEIRKSELPVAEWVETARRRLGTVASRFAALSNEERNTHAVTDVVSQVNTELAEWVTGRKRAAWFRDNPLAMPSAASQLTSLEPIESEEGV